LPVKGEVHSRRIAAASDYFALGHETSNQWRSDVAMNTPVERDDKD
jgi:hypothetical protein